jgi:CubicO group peptidase (beta-lactamase class C family)
LALCLLLFLITGRPSYAAQSEDPIARIENYLITAVENDTFSGSVLIAREGEILLSEGYGLAIREWNIPNTPDTKFRIGGVTKQFTAMAILVLQERGSLTVQDLICDYLEECPEAWQDITFHHLLTYTSGIPDISSSPESMMLRISPERLIGQFIEEPLDFQPGERMGFSNRNYELLGYLIEQISGDSYRRFLRENLFDPLGMADTDYEDSLSVVEHLAEGYVSATRRADYIDMSNAYAANGLYSTVEDLYRWEQALFGGQVVSQATWDAMLAAAVPIPEPEYPYDFGYGLLIGTTSNGHPVIRHGGGIKGFSSTLTHLTDANMTLVVLSNFEFTESSNMADTFAGFILD